MSAVDTRPFDQLWRDRVADFLMAEGPFAAAGEPSGQVDASAQLLTKPWDNDAYDRVGMPAPSRTGAATSTGGVDAQTGWNRYLAQACVTTARCRRQRPTLARSISCGASARPTR
jgi:hypothetical protein